MAARWTKVFNMMGFDNGATPHWQMVPVNGDRYLALKEGAGLTVASSDPSILTVTEIRQLDLPADGERIALDPSDRVFRLHGVRKASTRVRASSGATVQAELDVNTKDRKTVRLCFNFVRDSAGHHTVRVPASAAQWVRTINYVYRGQANISAVLHRTRDVAVPVDLGPQVMWDSSATSEWNTVTALRDAGADLNYFLVWEYEQDSTPAVDDTGAGTMGGNTIFEDDVSGEVGVVMAHELGHHLGSADHYDAARRHHLMHGRGADRGIHLPKADVNVMNP